MTTTQTVGSGQYTYDVDFHWAKVPEGWNMPAAAVYGDSKDRVYCFNRDPNHPVMIFDREGNFLSAWGAGLFLFPHAIILDKEDNVWLVERNDCQIMKFTCDGQLLMTIGLKGFRSNTGADNTDFSSNGWRQVTHGGDPFNLPAGIAINDEGRYSSPTVTPMHGCISSSRMDGTWSLGAAPETALDSSTYPTAHGLTARDGC